MKIAIRMIGECNKQIGLISRSDLAGKRDGARAGETQRDSVV